MKRSKNCNPYPGQAPKKQKVETVTSEQAASGSEEVAENGKKDIDMDTDYFSTVPEVSMLF